MVILYLLQKQSSAYLFIYLLRFDVLMTEKTEYIDPKTAWKDITVFDVPLKKWALYAVILIAAKLTLIHFGAQTTPILP